MSDNAEGENSRQDFADQLKEAVRKRKGQKELIPPAGIRRGGHWETLSEDIEDEFLALAVDKEKAEEYQRTSPPKKQKTQTSILKDWIEKERNLVLASLLLGGLSVLLVLVLSVLVYRQNNEIERLASQLESINGVPPATQPADFAALSMEVEQLQGRLQGLESQVSKAVPLASSSGSSEADERLISNLRQEISVYGNRIAALEKQVNRLKKPSVHRAVPVVSQTRPASSSSQVTESVPAGPWYINLASLTSRDAAEKLLVTYRQRGIEAKLQEVAVKDKRWYRLRMGPFANQNDATRNAERIKRLLQVKEVWVTH